MAIEVSVMGLVARQLITVRRPRSAARRWVHRTLVRCSNARLGARGEYAVTQGVGGGNGSREHTDGTTVGVSMVNVGADFEECDNVQGGEGGKGGTECVALQPYISTRNTISSVTQLWRSVTYKNGSFAFVCI